ncbi:YhdP family protein [Rhodocyclus gracilis]|uniref:TIGR02099 family protein n=1 Tax=Rhodocyclus tenuis TaxID=1066 RepID=A0A6L5JT87_RHOTE|nr:YhdP family protein [Rhodocyclus gracilis]MQY50605.1 TIGR02099 family protein [Rhodocyclus gracilis]
MAVHPLRQALYHRFHRLWPFLAQPAVRRLGRVLLVAATVLWFLFVAAVLVLRYSVLPNIEHYRGDIERMASEGLGLSVSIGRIEARWQGVNPDLALIDVRIADAEGRPALVFSRVQTVLSWWTATTFQLKLRLLAIDEPTLNLRRDADGQIYVAGIPLARSPTGSGAADWILDQRHIRVRGATIIWEDALRAAPALVLEDVNFGLDNFGSRHRFGVTALPSPELAAKIDLRGDLRGRSFDHPDAWRGQLYGEIDYADLAVWRRWIDYPVTLPQGRGAVRAWVDVADGKPRVVTADLALRDVRLRLTPRLPELELERMQGRLAVALSEHGFTVDGTQVALATAQARAEADVAAPETASQAVASTPASTPASTATHTPEAPAKAAKVATPPAASPQAAAHSSVTSHLPAVATSVPAVTLPPTDFHVDWQPGEQGAVSGSIRANRIDLSALRALAAYLPLDARTRQWLAEYAPQGRVSDLRASWQGDAESLKEYALKARFEALALAAQGYMPGFSGLAGSVDLTQKGGSASLRTQKVSLDVPSVFPEPLQALDSLNAEAKWTIRDGVLEAQLTRADFASADAAGSAQGSYRYTGEGPGSIDLTGSLSRADGRAVWRFMPHAVNVEARQWLHSALLAGTASDVQLTLKGDLAHFPFVDPTQGRFLVTARAHDVTLHYAPGWPQITGIDGVLRFEGPGMSVDVERASILGAHLKATHAEIPDFDATVTMLKVNGRAEGPTSEFLKFIDQSPVAEKIDHFTDDMRASGEGVLDLSLKLPLDLALMNEARLEGAFRLVNNEVTIEPALPPLRQVNGVLHFSEKALSTPEISGTLLGGPLQIKGGTQSDGRVLVDASGSINAGQLRRQFDSPLFDRLSGNFAYRGEVRVRKRAADLTIESNLNGLSSTLPEPFNKSANDNLLLRFEKASLMPQPPARGARGAAAQPIPRDQLRFSLGGVAGSSSATPAGALLSGQIIRRRPADDYVVERGAIAIGRPLRLPDRGLALNVTARQFDADLWRHLFSSGKGKTANAANASNAGSADSAPSAFTSASLRSGEMRLFGRRFNDVDLTATAQGAQWLMHLGSRQVLGDLQWDGSGKGKLSARLKQLAIESLGAGGDVPPEVVDSVDELPALDVIADEFSVGARHFGRLELAARNEGRVWRLDRIRLSNPAGTLSASGQWQFAAGNRTSLDFKLAASDIGKLLERLGYPGTVRGGTAQLDGSVAWVGPPSGLDFATLSGEMKLDAAKGQFVKVDPGAGKLIGLISLQSLPRRVTLDFRDIFSDGFAFDSMAGKLSMQGGIMHSDRLQIDGPAARVVMRGDTDLARETQRLSVTVQPELGGTAALGVALLNPVAGVATLFAHKILQNPLNHLFGFDYLVTGTWDDPKVEKLSRAASTDAPTLRVPDTATPSPGDSRDSR